MRRKEIPQWGPFASLKPFCFAWRSSERASEREREREREREKEKERGWLLLVLACKRGGTNENGGKIKACRACTNQFAATHAERGGKALFFPSEIRGSEKLFMKGFCQTKQKKKERRNKATPREIMLQKNNLPRRKEEDGAVDFVSLP